MGNHYLLELDGTGSFSSNKIKSDSCLTKTNKQIGEVTYYQQVVGAALVHQDFKEIIPLAPEIVSPQDGDSSNDCERNAIRRWLPRFRNYHPNFKVIVIEDALSANAPTIQDLQEHHMHYILLEVEPGSHNFLFSGLFSACSWKND